MREDNYRDVHYDYLVLTIFEPDLELWADDTELGSLKDDELEPEDFTNPCRNMSGHTQMGRPAARLETMVFEDKLICSNRLVQTWGKESGDQGWGSVWLDG